MSVVPPAIADVGATSQRLAQNPRFNPLEAGFGTEEYFVWSRFDGTTTLKDLILMTGLPVERAVAIVQRLWQTGAIMIPGAAPATQPRPKQPSQPLAPAAPRTMTAPLVTRVPT